MQPNPLCEQLPVFDLSLYLNASADQAAQADVQRVCAALASCLQRCSALVVRDPRVDTRDNDTFLSLLERYFTQPLADKMRDVRADVAYQVRPPHHVHPHPCSATIRAGCGCSVCCCVGQCSLPTPASLKPPSLCPFLVATISTAGGRNTRGG